MERHTKRTRGKQNARVWWKRLAREISWSYGEIQSADVVRGKAHIWRAKRALAMEETRARDFIGACRIQSADVVWLALIMKVWVMNIVKLSTWTTVMIFNVCDHHNYVIFILMNFNCRKMNHLIFISYKSWKNMPFIFANKKIKNKKVVCKLKKLEKHGRI